MIGINLYDSGNFLFIIFTIFCLFLSREIGSSTRNLNILWGQINAKLNAQFATFAGSFGKALVFVMIYVLEKPTFNQLD